MSDPLGYVTQKGRLPVPKPRSELPTEDTDKAPWGSETNIERKERPSDFLTDISGSSTHICVSEMAF